MPKQLSDFQSALVITTLGDGSTVVHIHMGNAHRFGPKTQQILVDHAKSLEEALKPLFIGFTAS